MCFDISRNKNGFAGFKIAKNDITVYKVLKVSGNKMKSPYYGMAYAPYHYYFVRSFSIGISPPRSPYYGYASPTIYKGLHAYSSKKAALEHVETSGEKRLHVFKMYIPRGSIYMRNRKEIVSSGLFFPASPIPITRHHKKKGGE